MNRKKQSNWLRYLFQFGILAVLILFLTKAFGNETSDPEAYCPFGGLETLATYFVQGSLACSMTMVQIMMGVILAVGAILFGKLFCSYICPLGLLNEMMMRLRRALRIKLISIRNGSVADAILRLFKYALLFLIFYITLSSSELFCKNFDPYYAFATGFKGELTVWMASISIGVLFLGGLLVDMFWCRYICPLGAISNIFKFTLEIIILLLVYAILLHFGIDVPWVAVLAIACGGGYLLEIFVKRPKLNPQFISIYRDAAECNMCGLCEKKCPYHIPLKNFNGKVTCVDCSLCGECVSACNMGALSVTRRKWGRWIPGFIAATLFFIALWIGSTTELPTIDVRWNKTVDEAGVETVIVPDEALADFDMTGMRSVKCYGSSMAFKAKLQRIQGVYGVKTFVKHGRVTIYYDPSAVTPEAIQEAVYTPTKFRISDPEPGTEMVKVITIRTENMYDKLDPNYLGMQFRNTGKSIFGVDSEYDCPLIVHVYMSPDEQLDEEWFKEIVNKKSLDMPVHGGGVKSTPVDFEFVRLEKGEKLYDIDEYLHMMFDPFTAEFNGRYSDAEGNEYVEKRFEHYDGQPQYMLEIAEQNYEKPIIKRALPYLGNHLSREEGVIGLYLRLNKDLVPAIMVRFAAPMTAERVRELMDMETWTITYSEDDVREEGRRMEFPEGHTVYDFTSVPE